ncbi:LamG-like jellyroll fold domain-containing protein [Christiangramia salexigens]|nr:LamG-like jellyroll fold domain-containing protein [Christiangramia salexigens]
MHKITKGSQILYVLIFLCLIILTSSWKNEGKSSSIAITQDSTTDASCPASADGSVSISVGGGVGPYTYAWTEPGFISTSVDINNLQAGTNHEVKVSDDIDPTIVAPDDINVGTDSNSCFATNVDLGEPTTVDNCNCETTSNDAPAQFPLGSTTVTWTVTDDEGNTATDTQIVTVVDDIDPTVITKNIDAFLDANGEVSITPADVDNGSNDNCGIASYSLNKTDFDCDDVGAKTVTLTVTDNSGNSSNANATVTVRDNMAPNAIAKDITVQLDSTGQVNITTTDIDNGSNDNCEIDSISLSQTNFTCSDVGANSVTLTVTDVNGNSSSKTATVTVEDNIAPTAIAKNITVQLDPAGQATITAEEIDNGSDDNCDIQSLSVSPSTFDCSDVGANPVILTVTDVNGNTSTANSTVTIEDSVAPVAFAQNFSVELDSNGQASISVADINNASSDNCEIDTMTLSQTNFDCSNVGSNTVTFTVTDVNGNSDTAEITVTVSDNIKPVITAGTDISVDNDNGQCEATVNVTPATASDNCSVSAPTGTRDDGLALNAPYPIGSTVITWTATDVNSNAAESVTQTVTVTDNEAPVPPSIDDIFWGCEYTVEAPVATDNCSGSITGTTTDPVTYSNSGTYTITWTFTDEYSNTSQITQQVVIDELEVAISKTDVECNGFNTGEINVTATGGVSPYTYSWATLSNGANKTDLPAGDYQITVTDFNGCEVVETITITQPEALSISGSNTGDTSCYEAADGSITAGDVSGGTPPYEYSIDNTTFQSSTSFTGLTAGDYTIFIQDANECALQDFVTVNEPDVLSAELSKTNVLCNGGSSGTITLSNTLGGSGNYEYSIDNTNWQTTPSFEGLTAGNYPVYIRDADATSCVILLNNSFEITEPTVLQASATSTRTTSYGSSTGTATVNATGGTPGYTYAWREAGNAAVITDTKTANNLAAGDYEVTVTDKNGCTLPPIEVTVIDAIYAEVESTTMCSGEEIEEDQIRTAYFRVTDLTAVGGDGNYTYSWDFGEGNTGTGPGEHTVNYNSNGNKTITLTIRDNGGSGETFTLTQDLYVGLCHEPCGQAQNAQFNVDAIYIGDINGNELDLDDPAVCSPAVNKYLFLPVDKNVNMYNPYTEITFRTTNGLTDEFDFQSDSDCRDEDEIDEQPVVNNNDKPNKVGDYIRLTRDPIEYLCGDALEIESFYITYTNVSKKDCLSNNNGFCYSTNDPVTVPTPVYVEATPSPVNCFGQSTGMISAKGTGGYAPYSFNITGENDPYDTPKIFNDLAAGSYTVYIKDSRGNTNSTTVTITQPSSAVTVNEEDFTITQPVCNGETGIAEVEGDGGTPFIDAEGKPYYEYLWNDASETAAAKAENLSPGDYTVTVTDANGCQATKTITIVEPPVLTTPDAGPDQNLNCGIYSTNLQANTPTEGVGTWTIDTANSSAGGVISDDTNPNSQFSAAQGTYSLIWTIANADGSCDQADTVTITIAGECSTLDFDGVDDHVFFDDNYGFTTGSFTIEVWVKPESTTGVQTIFSKRDKSNLTSGGYDLIINSGSPTFRWKGKTATTAKKLTTARWYHLAVIFDGNTAKLYVDGIDVGNASAANPAAISTPFILGAMYDSASPLNPKNYFSGWMEELRIWNSALSQEQLRFMMNQRVEANGSNTKGEVLPMDVPGPLAWNKLIGYYHLSPADNINGETPDISGTPLNGILRNIETDQKNSAPLPYVSEANGSWRNRATWDTNIGGADENWWDVPNGKGINGEYINWNIAQISNDINSAYENIYLLGLISESGELLMDGSVPEKTGNGLTVTKYLKLDGTINLDGQSQLVQTENSILEPNSSGTIEIDQQGTENSFNYNYWSSPVSLRDNTTNNTGFRLNDVLFDGSTSAPGGISYNGQYHWADGNYSGDARISTYWLYSFQGTADDYSEWHRFDQNTLLDPGIGYTMKGTKGYVPLTNQQNYTFKGKPNNGDIIVNIGANQNLLIGNPYPSAIDANMFIEENLGRFNGTIYYWDHFGKEDSHYLEEYVGGYAVMNLAGGVEAATSSDARINNNDTRGNKTPGDYIPVGQGFFVNSTGADNPGPIYFKNEQRAFVREATGDSQFLVQEKPTKKDQATYTKDSRFKIRLKFSSPRGYNRQILVTADSKTTSGYDLGYDAPLIDNIPEDMYWIIDESEFVIQGVPDFNFDRVLPLGVKIADEGEFSIEVEKLENFPKEINIYVHDKETDLYHNITKEAFQTEATTGEYNERYDIVFFEPTEEGEPVEEEEEHTEEEESEEEQAEKPDPILTESWFTTDYLRDSKDLILNNPELTDIKAVEIYSLTGQFIERFQDLPVQRTYNLTIERQLSSAIYIVRIYTANNEYSRKIIVQN